MKKRWQIAKKVVLYIEENEGKKLGTFHNFFSGDKAYINDDMVAIVSQILEGKKLESFFPIEIGKNLKDGLINQSRKLLRSLTNHGFLTFNSISSIGGKIKTIRTKPPLRVIFIETTKNCNLHCRHCYVPDCQEPIQEKQLSLKELQILIDQTDKMGVMEIQLTGGELFILPKAIDIIKDLQERLLPCSIFTNGTLLSPELFQCLEKGHHSIIFYISLHGPEKIHDKFCRVSGSYKKIIKSIRKLLEIGCDVRINTAVGTHNIGCLTSFIGQIKESFGILHRLVTVEPIGRAKNQKTLIVGDDKFADILLTHGKNFQFLDSHDELSAKDWTSPACGIGCSMAFVDAYGNVSLCPLLTQEQNPEFLAGNIREKSLREIWETSSVFNLFRTIQCKKIERCEFRELCKGGCRSRAYLSTGDINAPDEQMCYLYKKTKNEK